MKRIFILLLSVIVCIGFNACKKDSPESKHCYKVTGSWGKQTQVAYAWLTKSELDAQMAEANAIAQQTAFECSYEEASAKDEGSCKAMSSAYDVVPSDAIEITTNAATADTRMYKCWEIYVLTIASGAVKSDIMYNYSTEADLISFYSMNGMAKGLVYYREAKDKNSSTCEDSNFNL